jgi:hypothetical protein
MEKILVIFCLFWSSHSIAQTKVETQKWISETISVYAYANESYGDTMQYTIDFKGSDMIVVARFSLKGTVSINTYTIPIKELSVVKYESGVAPVMMYLSLKNNQNLIKCVWDFNNEITYRNKISIQLGSDVNKESLTKALNHLIKLNGGSVVSSSF